MIIKAEKQKINIKNEHRQNKIQKRNESIQLFFFY